MTEQLTFKTERIDDIPLLLAQLERMQVGSLLDEHFPTHGNWQGLSLGLRVLTLVEFTVRQRLQQEGIRLSGLYPGNPKRATARPTTEMMLRVFTGLTLVLLDEGNQVQTHLTALTPVQRRILELLDLPLEIYTRLTPHFSEPMLNLSEP